MANMIPISTVTVGSGGSTAIEFTGIPQTYTDLVIKFSTRDNTADFADNISVTFNGVGGTSYSERLLRGTGAAAASFNRSSVASVNYMYSVSSTATSSTFSNGEIYIPNYTSSNNKSVSVDSVTENNATSAFTALTAGLFSNTAPITSVKLASTGTFQQYSSATLYGIRKY
jgi:hypothetical protein